MLVGLSGGGKTKCYEVLQAAICSLYREENYNKVFTHVLNPKSVTMG